jgi:alanine racemase
VLNSIEQVARWRESGQGRPCDVMVDTGINRLGVTPQQARSAILDGLRIETLMSHLACADEPDHPANERQLALFRSVRQDLPAKRYSLANSAGICLGSKYAFGLTRPGLALYGGIPVPGVSAQEQALRPVAALEAQVVQVRDVQAGCGIGYNHRRVVNSDRRIAVLNIGYADGYLRQLGEVGFAKLAGALFPIAGVISMDLMAVDVTPQYELTRTELLADGSRHTSRIKLDPPHVQEGDWLTLSFNLPTLAAESGLTQYELLTTLGSRFERIWT